MKNYWKINRFLLLQALVICVLQNLAAESGMAADQVDSFPVTYEGEALFRLSHNTSQKKASTRAEEASKLISHAIEAKDIDSETELVKTTIKKQQFMLYVRGVFITTIYEEDAHNEGFQSLSTFADSIESSLTTVIDRELERQKWQSVALRFFISVIVLVLGFFLIRQLKIGFDKLEVYLLSNAISLRSIKIFGVPVVRNESFAGLFAFMIEVFRWLSYLASGLIIFVSILSQYEVTRKFLQSLARATLGDLVHSLQAATLAIPGVLLCLLILISLHIGVNALNLMLDGVKSDKLKSGIVHKHRIPIYKTVIPAVLWALFLPLAVAAFFQRFDTPSQWLVVGASLIAILGALPLLATWICGVTILWRNELREGDWVLIGDSEGEISSLNTIFINLVPRKGGMIWVPMLKVFMSPTRKYAKPPHEVIHLNLKKCRGLEEKLAALEKAMKDVVEDIRIKPEAILDDRVRIKVIFGFAHLDLREKVLFKLLDLAPEHNIELSCES